MKWVSVKDIAVPLEKSLLLRTTDGENLLASFTKEQDYKPDQGCSCCAWWPYYEHITHWMELPPKPTQEEEPK